MMITILGGGREERTLRVGPEGWGREPRKVGPEGWEAQNFALFFLSPAGNFILSPLLGVFSFNLGGLKRWGAQMCTLGVLGLSCQGTLIVASSRNITDILETMGMQKCSGANADYDGAQQ